MVGPVILLVIYSQGNDVLEDFRKAQRPTAASKMHAVRTLSLTSTQHTRFYNRLGTPIG